MIAPPTTAARAGRLARVLAYRRPFRERVGRVGLLAAAPASLAFLAASLLVSAAWRVQPGGHRLVAACCAWRAADLPGGSPLAMLGSALLVRRPVEALWTVAATWLVLGPLEALVGSWRLLLVAALGNVVPTVLVDLCWLAGGRHGTDLGGLDVGTSGVIVTAAVTLAVAASSLPLAAVVAAALAVDIAAAPGLATAEHLVALVVGVVLAMMLSGRMRRRQGRNWSLLVVTAALLAGCAASQGPAATTPTSPPATTPAAAGPERIVVVVEENHSFDQIVGSPRAPFLNHLAGQGTLLTGFYATTHPSLPNYIAMVSGGTQGITSDCGDCNVDAPNLVDQLEAAGISWKAYMEDLPSACSDAHTAGRYAKKHDPFMYFASVRDDPARCAKVVPAGQLDRDLATGRLPRFAFVTPDLAHDMHGTGEGGDDATLVRAADDWLRVLYGKLAGSPAWRQDTRLVVTWDEAGGGGQGRCCGGLAAGGHIATIVTGPRVPGGRDATGYDHYALLRSVENAFGLPFLGHAGDPSSVTIRALSARP